jgi:hypothetical protein
MSEGFGTKSADANENSRRQRKLAEVADIGYIQQSLVEHFSDIKDPRVERTKKHRLTDILVIAILAIIAGAFRMGRHRKLWHQQANLVRKVFGITKRYPLR